MEKNSLILRSFICQGPVNTVVGKEIMVILHAFPFVLQLQQTMAMIQELSARFIHAVLDVDIAWEHAPIMQGI